MKKTKQSGSTRRRTRQLRAATSQDILGQGQPVLPNSTGKSSTKWSKNRRNLLQLKEYLLSQINGRTREAHEITADDRNNPEDSGSESFDRDFALSQLSSSQNALQEIEAALKRIDQGTYGICEMTGKPVAADRLDAIPWTRYSREAQATLEREGLGNRMQLGRLGSVRATASAASEGKGDQEDASEAESDR